MEWVEQAGDPPNVNSSIRRVSNSREKRAPGEGGKSVTGWSTKGQESWFGEEKASRGDVPQIPLFCVVTPGAFWRNLYSPGQWVQIGGQPISGLSGAGLWGQEPGCSGTVVQPPCNRKEDYESAWIEVGGSDGETLPDRERRITRRLRCALPRARRGGPEGQEIIMASVRRRLRSSRRPPSKHSRCRTSESYSFRSATMGSTRVARRAGMPHASMATPASSSVVAANAMGSVGFT
jgi:hypothetical protein